jgi:hypothetical protein
LSNACFEAPNHCGFAMAAIDSFSGAGASDWDVRVLGPGLPRHGPDGGVRAPKLAAHRLLSISVAACLRPSSRASIEPDAATRKRKRESPRLVQRVPLFAGGTVFKGQTGQGAKGHSCRPRDRGIQESPLCPSTPLSLRTSGKEAGESSCAINWLCNSKTF